MKKIQRPTSSTENKMALRLLRYLEELDIFKMASVQYEGEILGFHPVDPLFSDFRFYIEGNVVKKHRK